MRPAIAPAGASRGDLAVVDRELPLPGRGQVRVGVRAAGVDPASWKSVFDSWPRSSPMPVGFESAGVVEAVGPGVRRVAVGDAVIAYLVFDGYASAILAPWSALMPKPDPLTFPEAANLMLVGTTADEMRELTRVPAGETIVIRGASERPGSAPCSRPCTAAPA